MIETARGAIAPGAPGRVLMHEHLFVLSPEFAENYPEHEGFREDEHVPEALRRLKELKEAGIDTIVDPTVIGLGRVQRVAAEVDVDIVVATGLYTDNDVPHHLHYLHFRGPGTLLQGEERVDTVAALCERGHAGSMVLSHDASCYIDWLPAAPLPAIAPNWHYLHITRDVLPAVRGPRGVRSGHHDDARGQPAALPVVALSWCVLRGGSR